MDTHIQIHTLQVIQGKKKGRGRGSKTGARYMWRNPNRATAFYSSFLVFPSLTGISPLQRGTEDKKS